MWLKNYEQWGHVQTGRISYTPSGISRFTEKSKKWNKSETTEILPQ